MMGGSGWCDFAAYARRSKGLEVLIPILYLKGVSTGDFEEALLALLGKDAGGLSASTSVGSRTPGRTSTRAGAGAISPPSAHREGLRSGSVPLPQCRNSHVPKALMWLAARLLISCLRALEHWIPRRSLVGFFRRVSAAQNGGIAFLEFAGCKHWSSAAWPP
jgi:hypothetical protein